MNTTPGVTHTLPVEPDTRDAQREYQNATLPELITARAHWAVQPTSPRAIAFHQTITKLIDLRSRQQATAHFIDGLAQLLEEYETATGTMVERLETPLRLVVDIYPANTELVRGTLSVDSRAVQWDASHGRYVNVRFRNGVKYAEEYCDPQDLH